MISASIWFINQTEQGANNKVLFYLAGIGIFLSKSQRGERPRLRESHLGGKLFLEGQHQSATSGTVLMILLLKTQPEDWWKFKIKVFSPEFLLPLHSLGGNVCMFLQAHGLQKTSFNFSSHFPLTLVLVELHCCPRIAHRSVCVWQVP